MEHGSRVGVCSWSLRPETPEQLALEADACGVRWVQLALDPIRTGSWSLEATARALSASGVGVASAMMAMMGEDYSSLESIRQTGGVRPEETWDANREAADENARIARGLGVGLVTFHAGFLPHRAEHPERSVMMNRLRTIADVFARQGVRVAFETGQESASTLLDVLRELDHQNVGVNFDPANMILYGMGDPVEALRLLGPHVVQVHVKDAVSTEVPGSWGTEVPVGTGEVDWDGFFSVLRDRVGTVDLIIEREAGEDRLQDIVRARELVDQYLAG